MAHQRPPVPPPGAARGAGAPGPGPQNHGPLLGGPPQMQRPQVVNSSRVVDVRKYPEPDEATYRKKFTNYFVYTARKAQPLSAKEDPTWARAEVVEERLDQAEIAKLVKKLKEHSKKSVAEQKAALAPYQQTQVSNLLDELISREGDPNNFAWSLLYIDRELRTIGRRHTRDTSRSWLLSKTPKPQSSKKETTTLTIYIQRAPLPHVNCKALNEMLGRIPPRPLPPGPHHGPPNMQGGQRPAPPPPPLPPPPPPNANRGGAPPAPILISKGDNNQGNGRRRKPKVYHDSASSGSSADHSDSDSMSSRSFSSATSISSASRRGDRGQRRFSQSRPNHRDASRNRHYSRSRSRPRAREHRKDYHTDRRRSPSPARHYNIAAPQPIRPVYPPEMPQIPQPAPGMEFIEAYRLGKQDANAERRGLEERTPRMVVVEQQPPIQPRPLLPYRPRRGSYVDSPRHPEPGPPPPSRALDISRLVHTRHERPIISPHLNSPRIHREERFIDSPVREYARVPEVRDYHHEPRFRQDVAYHPGDSSDRSYSRTPSPVYRDEYPRREREAEEYMDRQPLFERRRMSAAGMGRGPFPDNPFVPRESFGLTPVRRGYSTGTSSLSSWGR